MVISAFSPASIWNNATRTLTSLGTGSVGGVGSVNQTVAANSTVGFGPLAGRFSLVTVASTADASGTVVVQFTDATNTWTVQTIAAGATGGQDLICSQNTVFMQIHNNSATVAAKYWSAGITFIQ